MSTAKTLALVAVGYVISVIGGFAAVAVNELRMSAEAAQGSPGMVAFGDVVLFLLATGVLGLAPTWFLLRLFVEKAPRAVLAAVLAVAAMGPVSWLAMVGMAAATPAGGPSLANWPQAAAQLFGLFIASAAIPRMVLGPVLLVIEGVVFLLVRGRLPRALLAAAMLMDLVPLGLFALHIVRGGPRY